MTRRMNRCAKQVWRGVQSCSRNGSSTMRTSRRSAREAALLCGHCNGAQYPSRLLAAFLALCSRPALGLLISLHRIHSPYLCLTARIILHLTSNPHASQRPNNVFADSVNTRTSTHHTTLVRSRLSAHLGALRADEDGRAAVGRSA